MAAAATPAASTASTVSAASVTAAPPSTAPSSTTSQQATSSGPVPSIEEAVPSLIPLKGAIQAALDLISYKPSFESYLKLQKLLRDTEKIFQPFNTSKDKADKAYKFDLYKVVNTQINAISDESPKHLMDKIMKLNTLLTEGEVIFSGKPVTVKGNPMALVSVIFLKLFSPFSILFKVYFRSLDQGKHSLYSRRIGFCVSTKS